MQGKMLRQGVIAGLVVLSIQTLSFAAPPYGEPAEKQMQDALESAALERGGRRIAPGKIVVENGLAGILYEVTHFEKLGCEPSPRGPGYLCSYRITSRTEMYSNDGSAAGDRQVGAWNRVLNTSQGGGQGRTSTQMRRFLQGKSGWIAAMD